MQNQTNEESNVDIDSSHNSIDESKESKFKPGQLLKLIRVRFPGNSKSFPFLVGKRVFMYGQKVVAMSDRGMDIGYINSLPYEIEFQESMLPLRPISKLATDEDLEKQKENKARETEAEIICIRLIDKHELNMNLTHVEIIQFGKKAVFYFNAPARVDFRGLVKDLVSELKMRIELRQISVRDRAAALGGVGACGLQTCCSSFLKQYGTVSIKMAKNQNLALIPSKINGVCGQLKCCIRYEDEVYTEKRKKLPEEQSIIKVKNGDIGKVTKLHIMYEEFEMITDRGVIKKYFINMFDPKLKTPEGYVFPERFKHVTNETSKTIGKEENSIYFEDEEYLEEDEESNDIEIEILPIEKTINKSAKGHEKLEDGDVQIKNRSKKNKPGNKKNFHKHKGQKLRRNNSNNRNKKNKPDSK